MKLHGGQCMSMTGNGKPCTNAAIWPGTRCGIHARDERERVREWTVDCEECGQFQYIGPEPVCCPKCTTEAIETTPTL